MTLEEEVAAAERLTASELDELLRRLLAEERPPQGRWSRFRAYLRRTDFGPTIDCLAAASGSSFALDWGRRDSAHGEEDVDGLEPR